MSYQYGQEARDRISALGQAAVANFIDEVPLAFRKPFYERQPAMPGFRRGTPPEFKKKQERLVGHLVHPQLGPKGDTDWKLFAALWLAWAKNRLGVDFPVNDDPFLTPDSGLAFLRSLADQFPDSPRETVERLFCFSGFADHSDALAALGNFHPASTLARDRMINELPGRLDKIEDYIEIAEPAAEETAKRIDQFESDLGSLAKGMDLVASAVSDADRDVSSLRTSLDEVAASAETLEKLVQTLEAAGKQASESTSDFNSRAESLEQNLEALSVKAEKWHEFFAEISELKEEIDQIRLHEDGWTKTANAIDLLAERLDALEVNFSKAGDGLSKKYQALIFETEPQEPLVEINSIETACETIAWNLQACGILNGVATNTARQILAALATGQLIQFSGSIADLVADSVAAAVGGPKFHEWRVPVGLISDEIASDCLEVAEDSSGCLLIKGANRSAFEVYGTAIRDVVVRRQYSILLYPRLALIASWTQGPAAFSDGGTLAELGPVFDTDTFRMRGGVASLPGMRFGHLMCDSWDQLQGFDEGFPPAPVMELKDGLREAGFSPGNLWLRSAERAFVRLRTLPGASAEEDLHSLLRFWAQPWAKATAGPADHIARLAEQVFAGLRSEVALIEGI
ncbi:MULTISPECIES: hypothetical protein [unclassified Pseudomonas]|uniref:hypothetical protein n=1 Tax=unclassified Pseudomonas TaxID=196821 RepID=UPI001F5698C5|nr:MULTISPECIES: hypothetical protein [unclassified Pseudomonas]